MKTPKFLSKISAVLTPRPKKQLRASARAARPVMEEYDEEEPTTKLSSAFIVVLILHVVAVGGIYAFNSIKASRRDHDTTPAQTAAAQAPVKPSKAALTDAELAASGAPADVALRRTEPPAPARPLATGRQYEVKQGDTLTKIAFAYNMTPADIQQANGLKDGVPLRQGHILVIPNKASAKPAIVETKKPEPAKVADVPATKTTPGQYVVKKGDTAISIAKGLGITSEELLKLNKITDPKKLQPGQTLKVPRKS